MILPILLALGCAMAYGVSDFLGGVSSARLRVVPSTVVIYGLGAVTAAIALLIFGGAWTPAAVWWGAVAGLFAVAGTLAFYAALVAGPMSLGTPIVGTVESAVPVIVAVAIGERMTGWTWLAIVLAVAGGALVSAHFGRGARMSLRAGVLALIAGALFGASVVALKGAPTASGLIPALFNAAVGFVLLLVALGAARLSPAIARALRALDGVTDASPGPPRSNSFRELLPALAAGVLLGIANTLLVLALRAGPLAIMSVLSDLYPIASVVLAWIVLRERLATPQLLGVALAIGASALFAVA